MTHRESVCRGGQRCPVANLEQGLVCAIQHHPTLSEEAILKRAQIRKQDLVHWWNENQHRPIPAAPLMRIVRITQRYELLDLLLADNELDDVLMVVRRQDGNTERELLDELLDAQEATGQVAKEVRDARRDRRYDTDELELIERAASRAEAEHAQVRDAAKRMRQEIAARDRFPKAVSQ